MAQIFSRGADLWLRLALLGLFGGLALVFLTACLLARSDYATLRGWTPEQPIPFSHQHHVGGLKLDCQYCHTSVTTSAQAGLPPTETCMTCHSQIWTNAELLEPLRQSLTRNQPLRWNRVTQLPDYVYFHHDVHVTAGVGCVECHGRVDTMPLMRRAEPFQMQWCVDCHRDPAPRLRPPEMVTQMDWQPAQDRRALGERLLRERQIDTRDLTSCSVCHR